MEKFESSPTCIKCEGTTVLKEYIPAVYGFNFKIGIPEYIKVKCFLCKFTWDMETADAKRT